jgi:hypothetical protein
VSRGAKADALAIAAEPRADLLPPELREDRRALKTRRRLWIGALALALVMVAGTGLAAVYALHAQSNLAAEQATSTAILEQQKKYISVRSVHDKLGTIEAAQEVGTSTEIDWKKYLSAVQATLPANVKIDVVTIDSASPLAAYVQSTLPLQGSRVATLSFTAASSTLPEVPAWLDSLTSLPGYTDASPGSVTLDAATGAYTVDITMHINEAAFSKRFAAKGK